MAYEPSSGHRLNNVIVQHSRAWPLFVQDREGYQIYLTQERWEHALDHPGMHEDLLASVLVGRLARIQPFGPQQAPLDTPYRALGMPAAEMANDEPNDPLETLRQARRRQDPYDPTKFKYVLSFSNLPSPYTHIVVVVKCGWQGTPAVTNNFVLTAYMMERW